MSRNAISIQIPAVLAIVTDTHILTRTISRPLNQVVLHARNLVRCIPFNHAIVKIDYAGVKNILVGFYQQWSRVMFSDEFCYAITSDSGHQLLGRERETYFT